MSLPATLRTGLYLAVGGGPSKLLSDLGLSEPMLYSRSMAASEFTVRQPGRAMDEAPLFGYNAEVVVTQVDGKGHSKVIFRGKRVAAPAMGEGNYEGFDYIFQNRWRELERITYGQKWRTWAKGPPSAAAYVETSEVTLFTRVNTVSNTLARITNGEQVRDAVQWAIDHGVDLQIGQVTPGIYLPTDANRDMKVAAVIQAALKLCPDAVCEIDDSTTPPTFNCVQRADMAAVTVRLSDERIGSLKLTSREDLLVPAVVVKYKRTDEIDGKSKVLAPVVDAYPPGSTGFEDGAIMQTIELIGARMTSVRGEIVSEEIGDRTDPQWWIERGMGWLGNENYSNVVITPGERLGDLPYLLSPDSAGVAPWMKDDDGNQGVAEMEEFNAEVSYDAYGNKTRGQVVTLRLKTTNLASGMYFARKSSESGEEAIIGMAQAVQVALGTLGHDGELVLSEEECKADLRLVNVVNISGGTERYAGINAIAQQIVWNFNEGRRTVTLGWPRHLSIDDMMAITRANRVRRISNNPGLQGSGEWDEESEVEMPDGGAQENAGSGDSDYEQFQASGDGGSVKLNGTEGTVELNPAAVDGEGAAAPAVEGDPVILIDRRNGEFKITPTGTTVQGSISVKLSDGNHKVIKLREFSVCLDKNTTKKVILLGSDFY